MLGTDCAPAGRSCTDGCPGAKDKAHTLAHRHHHSAPHRTASPHPRSPPLGQSLEGHGQPINDIAVHPTHPEWVVTASKDNSLRLWNIKTRVGGLLGVGVGEGWVGGDKGLALLVLLVSLRILQHSPRVHSWHLHSG